MKGKRNPRFRVRKRTWYIIKQRNPVLQRIHRILPLTNKRRLKYDKIVTITIIIILASKKIKYNWSVWACVWVCGMRNRFKVQNTINTGQLRPEFNSTALFFFFLFFHFLEILSIISLNYKKYFFIGLMMLEQKKKKLTFCLFSVRDKTN